MKDKSKKMNLLPICNIAQQPIETYRIIDKEEYNELCKLIEGYVSSDCWAIKINDEIIYNAYETNKTYKEMLTEHAYRHQIMKNSHASILVHILRRAVNAKIEIYMFGKPKCYMLMFLYDANQKRWTEQQYNSPEYDSHENDNNLGLEIEF